MSFFCLFFSCRWLWHFNADDAKAGETVGVYQCSRCKTISVGAYRARPVS